MKMKVERTKKDPSMGHRETAAERRDPSPWTVAVDGVDHAHLPSKAMQPPPNAKAVIESQSRSQEHLR